MGPILGVLPYVAGLVVVAALHTMLHPGSAGERAERTRAAVRRLRHRVRRPPEVTTRRPLEEIVVDVRRLGRRFHAPQRSHVKAEGIRYAYDQVLMESCAALGVEHLLGVIAPGPELDRERTRVERVLHRWGVDLGDLDDAA